MKQGKILGLGVFTYGECLSVQKYTALENAADGARP